MKLSQLHNKSLLVLGLGLEGCSALRFLRSQLPQARLAAADKNSLEQLSAPARELLAEDPRIERRLGPDYLAALDDYDVIVKSPGIPVILPQYQEALRAGRPVTSPTAIFFANFPGMLVGITGTKGKSTTSSLIAAILRQQFPEALLLGNIGRPALDLLPALLDKPDSLVVFELSSHQLEGLRQSPHVAVLLNVVPEHLDYYASFEEYVAAKENIARYQSEVDWLVFDADHEIPTRVAAGSRAHRVPVSMRTRRDGGCFVFDEWIACASPGREPEVVVRLDEIPLLGAFNRINVAAAVAVGRVLGVPTVSIAEAVREFQPLPHRLERVGEFGGITFYNDSISTVPEATVGALDALAGGVETVLLGGHDRHLDYAVLADGLLRRHVRTLILFPPTGRRIWQAVCDRDPAAAAGMKHFFVESMEEAVRLAREHTAPGKVCLLSPASPSFGLFRDYRERGDRFKALVRQAD
jgi:UDP-N-acetylmuramoylalanine--D-glutamate ligase